MTHDWEYERRAAETDAFEAYCIEQGRDPEDPESLVWWEAHLTAGREAAAASLEP